MKVIIEWEASDIRGGLTSITKDAIDSYVVAVDESESSLKFSLILVKTGKFVIRDMTAATVAHIMSIRELIPLEYEII